jgi:hypothetical protein
MWYLNLNQVNIFLIGLILCSSVLLLFYFRVRRSTIGIIVVSGFLIRAFVALWLESGVKYDFVIDSMLYEYRAWLLAQKWISPDIMVTLTGQFGDLTYYETVLSWLFSLFGKDSLLAAIMNSLFGAMTILVVYRIQMDFLFEKSKEGKKYEGKAIITAGAIALYPSFLIWSATNIRDPMYFFFSALFFYFFLRCFSRRMPTTFLGRISAAGMSLFSFWVVLGTRSYVSGMFLASIGAAVAFLIFVRWFRPGTILIAGFILAIGFAYLYQYMAPQSTAEYLSNLKDMRLGFANLAMIDSPARSSFALEHSFENVTDILTFLPVSVSHYFFGPFPWEITGFLQALSFLETLFVYMLVYPTMIGVRQVYVRARLETVIFIVFVALLVLAQGTVISNMGTIFRHRTLPFLFLAMFAGEGLYEIGKKNFPALFKTEYWWAGNPRRKPLRRAEPVRV